MAVRERYQYVIELVGDAATRTMNSFGVAADGAERKTGRFRQTLGRAGTFLRENMVAATAAAGAALVAFSVQSLKAFEDAGTAAGKFADATGLSTEAASRWIEVADDIGVSGETVTSLFTRLNKAVGDNAPVVRELGIEQQRLADGTIDVSATMVQAIERLNQIEDPAKRAAAAQRLFGRNYAEASELIFGSAGRLKADLEGVSDALVIDDEERRKAEQLRDAMDQLGDIVKEVQLLWGEELAPDLVRAVELFQQTREAASSVEDAVPGVKQLIDVVSSALNPLGLLLDTWDAIKGTIDDLIPSEKDLKDSIFDTARAAAAAAAETKELAADTVDLGDKAANTGLAIGDLQAASEAVERAYQEQRAETRRLTDAFNEQRQRIDDLIGRKAALVGGDIAVRQAQRDAKAATDELNTALADQSLGLADLAPIIDNATEAQLGAAQAAADRRADELEVNGTLVDSKVRNQLLKEELQTLASQLSGPLRDAILEYIAQLEAIPTDVETRVVMRPIAPNSRYARGTSSAARGLAIVGEEGPELVNFKGGETVTPAGQTAVMMAGGSTGGGTIAGGASVGGSAAPVFHINVNAGIGTNGLQVGRQVVEALEAWARGGGRFSPTLTQRMGG